MRNTFEAPSTPGKVRDNAKDLAVLLKNSGLSARQIDSLRGKIYTRFENGATYYELAIKVGGFLQEVSPGGAMLTPQEKRDLFVKVDSMLDTLT